MRDHILTATATRTTIIIIIMIIIINPVSGQPIIFTFACDVEGV
jgi:hypothetical protein